MKSHLSSSTSIIPFAPTPALPWPDVLTHGSADATVLRFQPQQGAAVKISSSVFLCDLGLPWAHALRTNLFHQPCYGYDPTSLTSWMFGVAFFGVFWVGCCADMSSAQRKAVFISQICWRKQKSKKISEPEQPPNHEAI